MAQLRKKLPPTIEMIKDTSYCDVGESPELTLVPAGCERSTRVLNIVFFHTEKGLNLLLTHGRGYRSDNFQIVSGPYVNNRSFKTLSGLGRFILKQVRQKKYDLNNKQNERERAAALVFIQGMGMFQTYLKLLSGVATCKTAK